VTFYFFSTRLFENDFRRPLIKSLIAKGHEAWHVRIGRENILTGPDEERTKLNGIFGFVDLIKQIRSSSKISRSRLVFVDTTGAFVPIRSLLLRASLRGLWCFDIFDNLLYDLRGVYRLKRRIEISLLVRLSSIRIVLSRETLRLFPRAYHLENAAHVGLANRAESSFTDLVCLSTIDRRFDFTLVKELVTSAPELRVYLYGRLGTEDRETKFQFEELCTSSPNLIYRGEYRFEDVDAILASFGIGFTPYTTSSVLTEYINPDKYYLYLNSGMEVISTDIPQARRMADFIHIARSAAEIAELVARIRSEPAYRKNKLLHDFSWERRADEFIKIIQSHDRTIASDTM
jgi:hypothetical protein